MNNFSVLVFILLLCSCGSPSSVEQQIDTVKPTNPELISTFPLKKLKTNIEPLEFDLQKGWGNKTNSFIDNELPFVDSTSRISYAVAKNLNVFKNAQNTQSSLNKTEKYSEKFQNIINELKNIEFKVSDKPIEFKGNKTSQLNRLITNNSTILISNEIDIDEQIDIKEKANIQIICSEAASFIGRENYEKKPDWQPDFLKESNVNNIVSALNIQNSKFIQIKGCKFKNTQALLATNSQYINIDNILVDKSNGYGMIMGDGNRDIIVNNSIFSKNYASGILVLNNHNVLISNNVVQNGKGYSAWHAGIVITDKGPVRSLGKTDFLFNQNYLYPDSKKFSTEVASSNVLIMNNIVRNNVSRGIFIDGGYRVFIGNNKIQNNNRAGLLLRNIIETIVLHNDIQNNGLNSNIPNEVLKSEYTIPFGKDEFGNFKVKDASLILDNALYNIILDNTIKNNYGSGILLKRAAFFNLLGENTIVDNNFVDRGNATALNDGIVFNDGIDVNGMAFDVTDDSVQFAPSMGNIIYKNAISGKHEAGLRLCVYCEDNEIFENNIAGAKQWSVSQYLPRQKNLFKNNVSSVKSENTDLNKNNTLNSSDIEISYNNWTKRFQAEVDKFKPVNRADNIFIGSSTIRLWNLEKAFPGYNLVNRGFGGAESFETKSFMRKFLKNLAPKNIFIYVGENDVAAGRDLMRTIYHIQENMMYAKMYSPESKIFYISIKPSPSRAKFKQSFDYVNQNLKPFVEDNNGIYIDIRDFYFKQDGTIDKKLYRSDLLHFNDEGYDKLNSAIKEYIS